MIRAALRLVCAAVAASVMLAPLPPPAWADRDARRGLRVVGKVPANPDNVDRQAGAVPLILEPASRRGYQLFGLPSGLGIRSFDLDTLEAIRSVAVPGVAVPTSGGLVNTSQLVSAVDQESRRLFLLALSAGLPATTYPIVVLDEAKLEAGEDPVIARLLPPPNQPQLRYIRPIGISLFRDPASRRSKLLVAYRPPSGTGEPGGVWLAQWDVERAIARDPLGWADWGGAARELRSCRGSANPPRSQTPVARAATGPYVYTVCAAGKRGPLLAVRLRLGPGGVPDFEEAFPGPPGGGQDPFADAIVVDSGADRVHALGSAYGGGHELWTFEVASGRWVGRVGVTLGGVDEDTMGIDPASGRVYLLAPNSVTVGLQGGVVGPGGLMVVDGRLTPVPQPLIFNEFAYPSIPPIQVDPAAVGRPPRIFVRRGPGQKGSPNRYPTYPEGRRVRLDLEPFWLVIEDTILPARDPELGNFDRFTVDVEEEAGLTGSSFDGLGGAYAARLRLVRGLRGATRVDVLEATTYDPRSEPACFPDDRVITAAPVEEARLTTYQANARAAPLAADATTKSDLEAPGSRCQSKHPVLGGARSVPELIDAALKDLAGRHGLSGDPPEAVCVGDQRALVRDERPPAVLDLSAAAACSEGKQARATAGAALELQGLRVADSRSEVTVSRDPERGLLVRAEAWVSGVAVPLGRSTLRIDLVRAVATSWSNGRPSKGARASFERAVCGVRTGNEPPSPCYRQVLATGCQVGLPEQAGPLAEEHRGFCRDDLAALASLANRALGGRARLRAPMPDPAYRHGSPGGFVAGIQKRPTEQLDDSLLSGDFSLEVPALEIVLERDEGRQILQLAGVKALTTYGIFCLPPLTHSRVARKCRSPSGHEAPPTSAEPPAIGIPESGPEQTAVRVPQGLAPPRNRAPARQATAARFRTLIVRSALEGAFASGVWMSLLFPLVLAARRRAAMRSAGEGGGSR